MIIAPVLNFQIRSVGLEMPHKHLFHGHSGKLSDLGFLLNVARNGAHGKVNSRQLVSRSADKVRPELKRLLRIYLTVASHGNNDGVRI